MSSPRQTRPDPANPPGASPAPAAPRYTWRLLRAGPLRLDGGSMFGVVPRAVWSRQVPYDEQGRIDVAHNCLLLRRVDDPAAKPIVIEVGSGNKFDEKNRRIFGLSDRWVGYALCEVGCRCEDVGHVIVSHLHFDHAGGLTRRVEAGESADWTSPDAPAGVKVTFPNAAVHVQRREWEDALANNSVMTRTYLRENLEPIRDRVRLLEAPPPFPPGYRPRRDELRERPVEDRMIEVLPGIRALLVPGHTWGQQAILFTDERGRTVVFPADLLPTAHHIGAAYNMAYDVEPFISTVTRRWFLQAAAELDWLLVLDHEPGEPRRRVRADGKGWYEWEMLNDEC